MRQLLLACLLFASATAPALEVGDRLPALADVAWLGQPADPTGAYAIVDLWSPENPACRATMPRLTDLQRRHPEVRVIGLTAGDPAEVQRFVAGMGSRIGYAIGVVPSLAPYAPAIGIPIALLIDRAGTVLWCGDAMDAPEPLARVLTGTFRAADFAPPVQTVEAPAPAQQPPPPPAIVPQSYIAPSDPPPQRVVVEHQAPEPHGHWSVGLGLGAAYAPYAYGSPWFLMPSVSFGYTSH